jgi:hypothetical protein
MKRRLLIVALLAFMLSAHSAGATRPRPDAIPPGQVYTDIAPNALRVFNDYATPSRVYSSARAAVHYVTDGPDAPALNDDDGDGVPDYVERVAAAADTAIGYYERRGFASITPDTGGPDSSPDVYISRFAPGFFGAAFPAAEADGGAFVAISNSLDPSAARSLGSVYGTVAHELFHLVQFSSSAIGSDLPDWALEGMAAAMENRVFPGLDDIVTSLQLRGWFAAPQRGVTSQTYGSQLLWRFLDAQAPRLLPAFLRTARPVTATKKLAETFEQLTGRRFENAFQRFALWMAAESPKRPTALRTVRTHHVKGTVAPLAIHYLGLARNLRSVRIRFAGRGGQASILFERARRPGLPSLTRRLPATQCVQCAAWRIPRGGTATLVISDGDPTRTVSYQVGGTS